MTLEEQKKKIRSLQGKLLAIQNEIAKANDELVMLTEDTIYKVAESNPNPPKKISEHIFIIRYSDLIGNPWTPEFYNWKESARVLIQHLKDIKKPVTSWRTYLLELLNKTSGHIYITKYQTGYFGRCKVYEKALNRNFIERIVESL